MKLENSTCQQKSTMHNNLLNRLRLTYYRKEHIKIRVLALKRLDLQLILLHIKLLRNQTNSPLLKLEIRKKKIRKCCL